MPYKILENQLQKLQGANQQFYFESKLHTAKSVNVSSKLLHLGNNSDDNIIILKLEH